MEAFKEIAKKIFKKNTGVLADTEGQASSNIIREKILSDESCMIARFGSLELRFLIEYCNSQLSCYQYFKYFIKEVIAFNWPPEFYRFTESSYKIAKEIPGIFDANREVLSKFSELMLESMKELDVLGSWLKNERYFKKELSRVQKVRLGDIEPYFHTDPWSTALEGKKVLVVHPFVDTISSQYYSKRSLIFDNPKVLPKFDLKTIKSVQSLAYQKVDFSGWFDALEYMKNQINEVDFDVAIIGCGAYGFPLAAHVKKIGKKSVHMGGGVQIMFGIRGKRWDSDSFFVNLFNKHWVRPSKEEIPQKHKIVEGGSYW